MLNIRKLLTAKPKAHTDKELKALLTPWGEALDVNAVLPEHPRPQARRDTWQSLNGTWSCAFSDNAPEISSLPHALANLAAPQDGFQPIIVPYSPEAPLSGVSKQLRPTQLLWYQKAFDAPTVPTKWNVVLHFEAVDHACAVWLNGQLLGTHLGGYLPFAFDITKALLPTGNILRLCVADPSECGTQLRGKQRLSRGDIWYTAQSGIWKSVWLEWMPATHVGAFALNADYCNESQKGTLTVEAQEPLTVRVKDQDALLAEGTSDEPLEIEDAVPWSPDNPKLYSVEIQKGEDLVQSYCGFRRVQVKADESGHKRVFLNGSPLFLKGVLDQGYWPDGLMTPPSDEALVFDIQQMRDAGFNLLRKHIKVEDSRWYYHCDRLGMLVWQDMVSGGDVGGALHTSYLPTLLKASWDSYGDTTPAHQKNLLSADPDYQQAWVDTMVGTIDLLRSHPSIITWVLFNEGWGQFNAQEAFRTARMVDPTRPINATSGWYDQHCGHYKGVHNYFREQEVWPDRDRGRAFVVSEFGGLALACPGHTVLDQAYGYDTFNDRDSWRTSVKDLLGQMGDLEPKGLAGYVYTQLSDVEEEVNGLLTYDRRVNKLRD